MKWHILIFLLLTAFVVFLTFHFDSSYLNFGMHSDDWISLIRYRSLEGGILHKTQIFWQQHGPHATSQIIYMGILESIFGLNYKLFALINILFKILATLSLYPLILFVFKRRLLAFIAVIVYAISYSTIGTFHDVHKGTEYQAIIFMNIFLLIYYFVEKNKTFSLRWMIALIVSFAIAILLAPPRLFPLTFLPIFIELFLWIHYRVKYKVAFGIKKLLLLYSPFVLLFIYHPVAVTGAFVIPVSNIQKILQGNWFMILTPFSGLGYMFLWDQYWTGLLGGMTLDSFWVYLSKVVSQVVLIFGMINIFFAISIAQKKIRFIFLSIFLNFVIGVSVFFLATNHLNISTHVKLGFDFSALYSIFVGLFVFIMGVVCYIDWLTSSRKRNTILVISIGVILALYFIFCNWLFTGYLLSFSPTQEYLTIPAIGISLMISGLLIAFFDKTMSLNSNAWIKLFVLSVLILISIPIYSINKTRSNEYLIGLVKDQNANRQQDIQQKVINELKKSQYGKNKLVFFDWSKDKSNEAFYSEILYSSFTSWIVYDNGKIINGCNNQITNKKVLSDSVAVSNNKKGFLFQGVCVNAPNGDFFVSQEVFYEIEDFYAFDVKNNQLTDIKELVLKDIGIN